MTKPFFVLVAAATMVAAFNAEACNLANASNFDSLLSTNLLDCVRETGWRPPTPTTPDMYPKVCMTSCKTVIEYFEGFGLGDCTIGSVRLETDLIKPVKANCGWDSTVARRRRPRSQRPSRPSSLGAKRIAVCFRQRALPVTLTRIRHNLCFPDTDIETEAKLTVMTMHERLILSVLELW